MWWERQERGWLVCQACKWEWQDWAQLGLHPVSRPPEGTQLIGSRAGMNPCAQCSMCSALCVSIMLQQSGSDFQCLYSYKVYTCLMICISISWVLLVSEVCLCLRLTWTLKCLTWAGTSLTSSAGPPSPGWPGWTGEETNERPGTDHMTWGPMRGLEKTSPDGAQPRTHGRTDKATLWLNRPSGADSVKSCFFETVFGEFYFWGNIFFMWKRFPGVFLYFLFC